MRKNESGFSLVEVLIGAVFLTVGLLGLSTLLISNERSHVLTEREALLTNAFRNVAETVRSSNFADVLADYQGFTFTVDEINGSGTVTIFTDETDSSADGVALGLPRDLDGDGQATNVNVSASYMLLPVKVEITWSIAGTTETRSFYFYLSTEN